MVYLNTDNMSLTPEEELEKVKNELLEVKTSLALAMEVGAEAVVAARAEGSAAVKAVASALEKVEEELDDVKGSLAVALALSTKLTEALSVGHMEVRKATGMEKELANCAQSLEAAVTTSTQLNKDHQTNQAERKNTWLLEDDEWSCCDGVVSFPWMKRKLEYEEGEIEKTFKFYDIFDNKYDAEQNTEYCYVTINVKSKISGEKPIFDISYTYSYPNSRSQKANPFNYSKNIEVADMEGVIVFRNSLTEKLLEYLMMGKTETEKVSGGTDWLQYKIKVMETLANFWD